MKDWDEPGSVDSIRADRIIRALARYMEPNAYQTLLFTVRGWEFSGGMIVEDQSAAILIAKLLRPTAPFDFSADTDGETLLGLSTTYNAGTLGATWAPDYNNGPTQRATAGQALTINDISNFPDGGTMNIHITRGGYQVDFNPTYFEGTSLTITDASYIIVPVVDFGLSKLVVGPAVYS